MNAPNPRVLIVDDEFGMREGMSRILGARGYECRTAEDGKAALACLAREEFPIILVDLKMPGIDGFQFLERARQRAPQAICIIVSAFATIESAVQTTKMGAFDFVVKPFTPDDLMVVVNRAAEKWHFGLEASRLRAEREAHLLQLATEKSRLRTIMQSMGDGLLVVNISGMVVLDNAAARRLLNRMDRGREPKPLGEVIANDTVCAAVDEMLRTRADNQVRMEWEAGPRDGAALPLTLRTTLAPIRDEDGNFLGVVVLLSDISQAKEYERMKNRFISMVAHEIKAPIGAVESYLNLMEGGLLEREPGRIREVARRCLERTGALITLVGDLLEITRRDTVARTRTIERVDVAKLAAELVEFHAPVAAERKIELTLESPEEQALVWADAGDMERMLGNLLSNAIKYNREGGRVLVRLGKADGLLRLEVRDTGIGMDAGEVKRLGEEFFRAKNKQTRFITGTGLGIALVKKIVASYNGVLEVESSEGIGSTFRILLPAGQEEPAAAGS